MARIRGSAGNDTLRGTNAKDSISAYGGNDVVYGYGGNDTISAGLGRDTAYGGDGNDTIRGGGGEDKLLGSDGNDLLFGDAGNDILSGGDGRDILVGGAGSNQLFGGAGADVFRFLSSTIDDTGGGNATADHILDFRRAANDAVDVSAIDANTRAAGNQAFTWIGTAAFSGTPGQARYDYYENFGGSGREIAIAKFDVNGDSHADLSVWIENPPAHVLVAGDFIL